MGIVSRPVIRAPRPPAFPNVVIGDNQPRTENSPDFRPQVVQVRGDNRESANVRRTYKGKCQAVVQAEPNIVIEHVPIINEVHVINPENV
ncbi:unnamed protein product [Rhizoctonia solani]|uniref:Uncharacterized protein n=1 Tax=Rhizoctonia solani TaxID=456999 RepID=A0A8H3D372_9AGAM|nr:unnamed protein product [Rhizoctonia solani]